MDNTTELTWVKEQIALNLKTFLEQTAGKELTSLVIIGAYSDGGSVGHTVYSQDLSHIFTELEIIKQTLIHKSVLKQVGTTLQPPSTEPENQNG